MNGVFNRVRPMQERDVGRICEIYLLAHVDEYTGEETDFPPEGIEDNPALLQMLHQSQMFVYDENLIKGFAGTYKNRIIWLYVHPEYRGQQVGKTLVDFMLTRMEGQIGISVIKSNQPALKLYQSKGFKVIGDFVFNYQGVPVEAFSMQLFPTNIA